MYEQDLLKPPTTCNDSLQVIWTGMNDRNVATTSVAQANVLV